jgi:hypothetical protein
MKRPSQEAAVAQSKINYTQGCQMVYIQTKNPHLDKFWKVSYNRCWQTFFMAVWNILRPFGLQILWPFGKCVVAHLVYRLVRCSMKNLATLTTPKESLFCNSVHTKMCHLLMHTTFGWDCIRNIFVAAMEGRISQQLRWLSAGVYGNLQLRGLHTLNLSSNLISIQNPAQAQACH